MAEEHLDTAGGQSFEPRLGVVCPIAVLILAKDEELNLSHCLASVSGWTAEVHLVDSGSQDRTIEIARKHGASVYHHDYVDHPTQLAWAFASLPIRQRWILLLDADNIVSDRLRPQIQAVVPNAPEHIHGYYIRHAQMFRGVRIHGMKGERLRLVRRDKVRVDPSELVDFRLVVDGDVGHLAGAVVEYQRKDDDLDALIDKHQRFALRMAEEESLRRSGQLKWHERPRLLGTADQRAVWLKQRWYGLPLFLRPVGYFIYRYVFRLGFLDGRYGFIFHFTQALWFRMLVDAHLADIEAPRRKTSA